MDKIKEIIRKRLSYQHRGKNMIWILSIKEIKSHLNIGNIDPEIKDEILTWYVKNDKLFIKTTNQSLKIKIFKEKNIIIPKINKKLLNIWYRTQIQDILLK